VIDREKYLERQRRYNTSEKGRARGRRYRRTPEQNERSNALRMFAGATYMGRARTIEQAEQLNTYLALRIADFRSEQRAEYRAFSDQLERGVQAERSAGESAIFRASALMLEEVLVQHLRVCSHSST
jgi:hypothetical protein